MTVARELGPSNFGLIGMANAFLGMAAVVNEFGMSGAIVSLPSICDKEIRQLNFVSVSVGVSVFLVTCAIAKPLGLFFHAPSLPMVVIAMSIVLIIGSFRNVPDGLLKREFNFKFLATARALETLIYGITIVTATWLGAGYWSLVIGAVLGPACSCAFILLRRSAPFEIPNLSYLKKPLQLSWHILINRLGGYGYSNADSLIAGRMLGQTALGSYNLAFTLANLPMQRISDQVGAVIPAYFSNVQRDEAALRDYVLKITEGLMLLILPISIGLSLVADDLVIAIVGTKWVDSIQPLRILAFFISTYSAANVFIPMLNVRGNSRFVMWNNLAGTVYLPLGFYVGSHWGTVGIAAAWPLLYPFVAAPLFIRAFRELHLSWDSYLRSLYPALTATLIMAASVLILRSFMTTQPHHIRLVTEILLGAAVYCSTLATLHPQQLRRVYHVLRPAHNS